MNVLQVTPRYFPNIGGVEVVVQTVSEILITKGASVTVYSLDLVRKLQSNQTINGVCIKRFRSLLSDPFYIPEPRFVTNFRKESANIIHIHNIHTLLPLITTLCKHKHQKIILQPHYHGMGQTSVRNFLFNNYMRLFRAFISTHVDCVIVNSLHEKKLFNEAFPAYRNVVFIPEGIAVNELKRVRWNPEKPARILYIGALRYYKNVDKLLYAFASLSVKEKEKFKLVIVGRGPEYLRLVALAKKLGISNLIEWKYKLSRSQLLSEYAKASVFVSLSSMESFGRAIYEALIIGVPTVVLNFGAMTRLVKEGLAVGVNSANSDEIADSILRAMKEVKPKARRVPSVFLSWEEYVDRILGIYNNIAE